MGKHARLPTDDGAPEPQGAEVRTEPRPQTRYYAFLSYSHKDRDLADWLHRELERFRVPHALAGRLTANGVVPKRLTPIFRDEQELAAGDLAQEIKAALSASQFLIVLCSPDAAKSRWTNQEIEEFKRTRPEGCVLAAIARGEPFASDIPDREDEECFPPALTQKYDRLGRPTGRRAEPLAADLRGDDDQRRQGFLKLVAGMLGVGLDELVQRETTRRQRRLAWLAAASLGGMAVTSTLAVAAIESRNSAREQRREAEGLVAFMLGDLKDKLEPIGKLDALDGVGSRVLAYYHKQGTSDLSDSALLQRSRALSLMAEVADSRGDLGESSRLYREAMAGTGEAVRRNPSDPQRLFDHAQNVFWVGDLARQRGQVSEAETGMREYKRLADRMVEIAPDNMKWRMEQQSADTNLGVILFEQRRFGEATGQFNRALRNIEALATADSQNADYQKARTESQTWLADALESSGRLQEATMLREQHVALLRQLLDRTGDVEYRQKLVPAERLLGDLYLSRGRTDQALAHTKAAVTHAEYLIAHEPENMRWQYYSARARITLAQILLAAGNSAEASAETANACSASNSLVAKDPNVQRWRENLRECWMMRARLSVAGGDEQRALTFAQRALDTAKSVRTTDSVDDKYGTAKAYRLLGDIRLKLGDRSGARTAWSAGLAALSVGAAEKPGEMAEHAMLLERLGRTEEARQRSAGLRAMGYRGPEFRNA
jgi:tetratricopeptide (TPR) repeat protein